MKITKSKCILLFVWLTSIKNHLFKFYFNFCGLFLSISLHTHAHTRAHSLSIHIVCPHTHFLHPLSLSFYRPHTFTHTQTHTNTHTRGSTIKPELMEKPKVGWIRKKKETFDDSWRIRVRFIYLLNLRNKRCKTSIQVCITVFSERCQTGE